MRKYLPKSTINCTLAKEKEVYKLILLRPFELWFQKQQTKEQLQIVQRLQMLSQGHLGLYKILDKNLLELKWKNGRRVYLSFIPESKIVVLLGGNKNGQDKDIRSAQTLCKDYHKQNQKN